MVRCAAIDEGEPAFHIHAPDTFTDGVQNRLMLARQCIELFFGLRLLGDVDPVAEHKRIRARELQQLVAIGDDAQLARLAPQIKAPLVILIRLLLQCLEIRVVIGQVIGVDVVAQRSADQFLRLVAQSSCCVRVDGEQHAIQIVGANKAQAAFHQLPVALFTGAQSGFGFPLLGHVRTGHDHKAHLVLGIGQRCGGPGNAPHTSCLGAPVDFIGLGGVAGAHLLEDADGGLAFPGREELFRKGAAGEVGKTVAGNGFAGTIEAHDTARRYRIPAPAR